MPTVKELITSLELLATYCDKNTKIYFCPKDTGDLHSPNIQTLVEHARAGKCAVMSNATPDEFSKLTGLAPSEVYDMRKGKQH